LNTKHVYISSDSNAIINAVTRDYAPTVPHLQFYHIDYNREAAGLNMSYLKHHIWSRPEVRALIDIGLSDLYIASKAIAWVGTLSSNWCRLQNEIRCANGRCGSEYHSLDAEPALAKNGAYFEG